MRRQLHGAKGPAPSVAFGVRFVESVETLVDDDVDRICVAEQVQSRRERVDRPFSTSSPDPLPDVHDGERQVGEYVV